jgi:hypothetical protein
LTVTQYSHVLLGEQAAMVWTLYYDADDTLL